MQDFVYYLTLFINFLICVSLILFAVKKSKCKWSERKAKNIISLGCFAISIFGGVTIFLLLTSLFEFLGYDMYMGHGEIIARVLLFNFMLALFFAFVGRVFIEWKSF